MDSNTVNYPQSNDNLADPKEPSNSDLHSDIRAEIEQNIAKERVRQAHHSFNLALTMTGACTILSLVGVGMLLLGKATEGTVTAVGGAASSVRCYQLAKDANDRLDKILTEHNNEKAAKHSLPL